MHVADLQSLLNTPEKLCPELEHYANDGVLGKMLHHPLTIQIMYNPEYCGMVNAQYRHKRDTLDKYINEGNFTSAIFLHERPYRFTALLEYINDYNFDCHPDFWKTVGHIWIDSENIHESFERWHEVWSSNIANRDCAMTDDDREAFSMLSDTLVIYRGVEPNGTNIGMSWSLDRDRAAWFARRFSGGGKVFKTMVAKDTVLAYFTGRGESEIVVLPNNIKFTEEEPI